MPEQKTFLFIDGRPAGITATFKLLERTMIIPIILLATSAMGELSKSVEYTGNRIDIGVHRFNSQIRASHQSVAEHHSDAVSLSNGTADDYINSNSTYIRVALA